ncbi:hypothetical protein M569_13305, partial [Genlisea aurea]
KKKKKQMHGQQPMQYAQSLLPQQGRQITSAQIHMGQPQLTRQLNQFSGAANNVLFNAGQQTTAAAPQILPSISAMMPSQSILPRMQFGIGSGSRTVPPQTLADQSFNIGSSSAGGIMPIMQQQQPQPQPGVATGGAFAAQGSQNAQQTSVNPQSNFQPQRSQNQ